MRKTAIGIGATATAGVGLSGRGPSPVGEAEAIAPLALAAGAAISGGAGVGAGWLVRSVDPFGSDEVAGQTPDALKQSIYVQAKQLESNTLSTFVDNDNLVGYLEDTVYTEAKVAVLDRSGEGLSEDALYNQTLDVVNEHQTIVLRNLLESYNESIRAVQSWLTAAEEHPDLSGSDILSMYEGQGTSTPGYNTMDYVDFVENEVQLPNGDTFAVLEIEGFDYDWSYNDGLDPYSNDPEDYDNRGTADFRISNPGDGDPAFVLLFADSNGDDPYSKNWWDLVSQINSTFEDVKDNLDTWLTNVYADISDGSIDVGEAAGPLAMASLASEEESTPMAAADLRAMGIPVDTDRETEVHLSQIGATLYGAVGVSGDYTLTAGETIDPSTVDQSFYLTYDTSRASGVWKGDFYDSNLSQGVLTFSEEPLPGVLYQVTNTEDETAEVSAADFTADAEPWNNPTAWTVDLSDQLENASGTVLDIEYFSESGETNFETIQLTAPFDIVSITDAEGEEITEASYETRTPQDDTNYITQDEWDEIAAKNQELIDKYEESQTLFGAGGFLDGDASDIRTLGIVAGGAALAALLFGNN